MGVGGSVGCVVCGGVCVLIFLSLSCYLVLCYDVKKK